MSPLPVKSILRIIVSLVLVGLLSACNIQFSLGGFQPSRAIVQRAIAMQLNLTKTELTEHLRQHNLDRSRKLDYEINRVVILNEEPVVIQDLIAYHIRGTYNLTFKLPDGRVTDRGNPFEIYLQLQKEAKSWRLARQQSSGKNDRPVWASYLIKPRGYL
jgi:hypothetical protein